MTTFVNRCSSTTFRARRSAPDADSGFSSAKTGEEQDELNWEKANEFARSAACELELSNGDSAAGTLYEVESGKHLFVSVNKRLPFNSPNFLCNAQLLLNFCELREVECNRITLSGTRVCHVWNTQSHGDHTGITIVELSDEAAIKCQSRGAKFLRVGKAHTDEEVCL